MADSQRAARLELPGRVPRSRLPSSGSSSRSDSSHKAGRVRNRSDDSDQFVIENRSRVRRSPAHGCRAEYSHRENSIWASRLPWIPLPGTETDAETRVLPGTETRTSGTEAKDLIPIPGTETRTRVPLPGTETKARIPPSGLLDAVTWP